MIISYNPLLITAKHITERSEKYISFFLIKHEAIVVDHPENIFIVLRCAPLLSVASDTVTRRSKVRVQ